MSKLQVKKANFLVPLEEAVSKPAQLLASYIVASLPKTNVEESEMLPKLKFDYTELRRALNADGKERVNKVQDIMELGVELQRCVLFYEDNVSERTVTWLIDQERNKQSNVFTYSLHPGLGKYLTNLEKHFTRYNYLFRVCLNAHAMKLYEILKMYQYLGEVTIHIEDDLKPSLGLANKYPKIYELKRRVLDVAQKEIAKYTDISFEYEVAAKRGKTPISFLFKIYAHRPTDLPPKILDKFKAEGGERKVLELPFTNEGTVDNKKSDFPYIYTTLEGWGGKENHITNLIEGHGKEGIEYQIRHLQRILKVGKKKVLNPFAWFVKALQEDYRDTVQDAKNQKKVQIIEKKKKVEKREELEARLKRLNSEYFKEKSAYCDILVKKDATTLSETVESMRGSLTLKKGFQAGNTPAEMYADDWMRGSIQAKLEERYPDHFAALKKKYDTPIEVLKKKIRQF